MLQIFRRLMAIALVFQAFSLSAQSTSNTLGVQAAYYPPTQGGYGITGYTPWNTDVISATDSTERDLGSGWGGAAAELYFTHKRIYPALQGSGALTSGNNLAITARTGLSPVTITQSAQAVFTPIAFLTLGAKLEAGTGWQAFGFNGLAINNAGVLTESPFDGVVLKASFNPGFQFDLAAVMPGDWNHIVILAGETWTYQNYTAADENTPWAFLADSGQNYNGWLRSGSYFLGHQPPIDWIGTYGILVENWSRMFAAAEIAPMDSAVSGSNWGSDYVTWSYSLVGNFVVANGQELTVLLQASTYAKYSDATTALLDFTQRDYEGSNWSFNQIALVYTYSW